MAMASLPNTPQPQHQGGVKLRMKNKPTGLALTFVQKPEETAEQKEVEQIKERLRLGSGRLTLAGFTYPKMKFTDLRSHEDLSRGDGAFGAVRKMAFENRLMAVKRLTASNKLKELKNVVCDLETLRKSRECKKIVTYYGFFYHEMSVYICMERMACSLAKLIQRFPDHQIPEVALGHIAAGICEALNFMKTKLNMLHRDIKPGNILLNNLGQSRLCDFGISGDLSATGTGDAMTGCIPYLAPERMRNQGYDERSDVWSLGLTLVEVVRRKYPYTTDDDDFKQLTMTQLQERILSSDPPLLQQDEGYSTNCRFFIEKCLEKDPERRPSYPILLAMEFVTLYGRRDEEVYRWWSNLTKCSPMNCVQRGISV